MSDIRVIGERILVTMNVVEDQEVLNSGLIIEKATVPEKKHVEGVVVQLGIGDFEVEVGETVLYGKFSGIDFKHKDVIYTLLKPTDIFGVLNTNVTNEKVTELKGLDPKLIKEINSRL